MLHLGSFSHSLASPYEVVSTLIGILTDVDPKAGAAFLLVYRDTKPTQQISLNKLVERVVRELSKHCPPFTYCGHRVDDPSIWGVWVDLGQLHAAEEKGDLIQVGSHSKLPKRGTYLLDLEGKGATLYRRRGMVRVWEAA